MWRVIARSIARIAHYSSHASSLRHCVKPCPPHSISALHQRAARAQAGVRRGRAAPQPMAAPASLAAVGAWRGTLLSAMKKNASLPNAKYVQLATVRPNGRPANRSVVFRCAAAGALSRRVRCVRRAADAASGAAASWATPTAARS